MIIDPYETTLARPYQSDKIRSQVTQAAISDGVYDLVFRIREDHREVSSFTQPILFETPGNKGLRVAVDSRQYKGSNSFVTEQLDLLELRAALTLYGAREGNLTSFYHPVASTAFANLIAGIISQRFGIDPKLKAYVTVVAAAHYYNITHQLDAGYGDQDIPLIMQAIMRDLRLPADIVEAALDKCEYGDTMESLCENIRRVDGTERTTSLVPGLIINSSGGLWYGINAAETVGISYEHAPTFCALLFNALGDGSYSRGEMAKRLKYIGSVRQKAENFRKSMRTIQSEITNA
jgi:hypothetical protein